MADTPAAESRSTETFDASPVLRTYPSTYHFVIQLDKRYRFS
jgi:hypothetical protein